MHVEHSILQQSRHLVTASGVIERDELPPRIDDDFTADLQISHVSVICCSQQHPSIITFCVSRRRRKMYCGHARLCVCVSVCVSVCLSAAVCPHYCTDPDVTWGSGSGCPPVVHCWADLQSVHRLRCYGNITRTLVYAGCARVAD